MVCLAVQARSKKISWLLHAALGFAGGPGANGVHSPCLHIRAQMHPAVGPGDQIVQALAVAAAVGAGSSGAIVAPFCAFTPMLAVARRGGVVHIAPSALITRLGRSGRQGQTDQSGKQGAEEQNA